MIVTFAPKNSSVEHVLYVSFREIRTLFKVTVCDISEVPYTDVIVNLNKCDIIDADPAAADFIVFLDTCPDEKLEAKADLLCNEVAKLLISMGLTANCTVEVWPRFLPGSWCLIKDRHIVDVVKHSRIK